MTVERQPNNGSMPMAEQQNGKNGGKTEDEVLGVADPAIPNVRGSEESIAVGGFRLVERGLLITVALMTLAAAALELSLLIEKRSVDLADILLMFLYTEVIGMVAVYYTGRGSPFVYPIFIAITALARLIVLQGKDMAPENILFEAAAILLLAIAVVIILRGGKS